MTRLRPDAGSRSALAALAIIEEVAAAGPGITALEITHRLRMSRSAAYRLLGVLVESEYLVRTPDLGGFALGRRIDRLVGIPSTAADRLREAVDAVRAEARFGIHLVLYQSKPPGQQPGLELFDIDPDFPLSDPARIVGNLDCSAIGRVVAAEVRGERPMFASQCEMLVPGFGCVATPIRSPDDDLVAVLAASAPAHRVADPDSLVAFLAPHARTLALLLSAATSGVTRTDGSFGCGRPIDNNGS
jgi:IclR helix-turn-helix domain